MRTKEESQAVALRKFKADIFATLANPTRIHIIECLTEGELPVGKIVERIGVEPSNASQHLAVLRSNGLVLTRKQGNQVYYCLRDPMLAEVLCSMRSYFRAHITEALEMLKGIGDD